MSAVSPEERRGGRGLRRGLTRGVGKLTRMLVGLLEVVMKNMKNVYIEKCDDGKDSRCING